MYQKLYRSRKNKMIAGICGGLGEYFAIDPTIIRLLFIFALFMFGIGVIPYLVGWIIIPLEPRSR